MVLITNYHKSKIDDLLYILILTKKNKAVEKMAWSERVKTVVKNDIGVTETLFLLCRLTQPI